MTLSNDQLTFSKFIFMIYGSKNTSEKQFIRTCLFTLKFINNRINRISLLFFLQFYSMKHNHFNLEHSISLKINLLVIIIMME